MPDLDRLLQDYFDRRQQDGAGEPPADADEADLAAYRLVYESLSEPPEGDDLPADFAESVADRVGLDREPAAGREPASDRLRAPSRAARPAAGSRSRRQWSDELPIAALLVASVVALLFFPISWSSLGATFAGGLASLAKTLGTFVGPARLDILAAAAAALGATGAADALLRRWKRVSAARRPRVSST
jgi:hypothetical protein